MNRQLLFALLILNSYIGASHEITPYKYDNPKKIAPYTIPASCRFTVPRLQSNAPDIVYYFSKSKVDSYPIAIVCGGSSSRETVASTIYFHRYLLQEFLDCGAAVITLEQWGVDGDSVDANAFMNHYTQSQRLLDHQTVIDYLTENSPAGWNGKFIFLGCSEGGPLVTSLTQKYAANTVATINWSGTKDWPWRDEVWAFLNGMIHDMRWYKKWFIQLRILLPKWAPFSLDLYVPKTRREYDAVMDQMLKNPVFDKEFAGMTYAYHADALTYPAPDYSKITTPFLVVTGVKDTVIGSSDAFVEKAQAAGVPITYMRVPDMDHYIRNRPDIIEQSFAWLKKQIY